MRLRILFLSVVCLLMATTINADDAGIAEVRLIEEENNNYALEVDVPLSLLATIKLPVLPRHCTFLGEPEVIQVGPMLVVRFRFTSGDEPLQPEDELLLYWQRSGIVLTAYWLDGSSRRVFLDRELTGIRVPVRLLREVQVSQTVLLQKGIADAVSNLQQLWLLYLLLIGACASLGSPRRMVKLLLAFAAGHALSMVATDLGAPSIIPGAVVVMMGIAAMLMFIVAARGRGQTWRFWPVILVLGLIHGLGYAGPVFDQPIKLSSLQLITASFAYNMTIDLVLTLTGLLLLALKVLVTKQQFARRFRPAAINIAGGFAVAAILTAVPDLLAPPVTSVKTSMVSLSGSAGNKANTRAASRSVELTDPILGFVTITPFEIRCEWLLRVLDLNAPTTISGSGEVILPVEAQVTFKNDLLARLAKETIVTTEGRQLDVSFSRADFVTVANYGVTTRKAPTEEPLDQAVIGLTFAYSVDEAPEEVSLQLQNYPHNVGSIPVAFTDPWGSTPKKLTQNNPQTSWKRRMAGFRRPVIQAVTIEPPKWPIVSVFLLFLAAGSLYLMPKGRFAHWRDAVLILCIALATVAYPFARVPAPGALAKQTTSGEQSGKTLNQLLTNIYRAFDYRSEEAIYDQLAVSATGDQLATIYLEHRAAMELEERGGARASVDKVDVLDIRQVSPTDDGLSIDATWAVSGSVSHFGHLHYRKNRYDAIVYIIPVEGAWKISRIDVKEMEREL